MATLVPVAGDPVRGKVLGVGAAGLHIGDRQRRQDLPQACFDLWLPIGLEHHQLGAIVLHQPRQVAQEQSRDLPGFRPIDLVRHTTLDGELPQKRFQPHNEGRVAQQGRRKEPGIAPIGYRHASEQ